MLFVLCERLDEESRIARGRRFTGGTLAVTAFLPSPAAIPADSRFGDNNSRCVSQQFPVK
jgi:hypothetical protein